MEWPVMRRPFCRALRRARRQLVRVSFASASVSVSVSAAAAVTAFSRVAQTSAISSSCSFLMSPAADDLAGDQTQRVLQELRLISDGGLALLYALAPFGGARLQCIDMAVGDSDLVEVGMTPRDVVTVSRSLRTGASGHVILAYLPTAIQRRVLAEPVVEEAGPGVITGNAELLASLVDIRDQGYATGTCRGGTPSPHR
ncbi:IclR family transcriptional regulator C-terminal domain-containing protein [Streptomyces endocoffeicus]|uniref:IclR family transcriptional regulator C-terminal domain-containing protein n=1 Tax=Streptomyces endocoffeicus TaxID=2898945 RepID=UPI001E44E234|nr:IclR family transcriptional regulator C-terminal domain-containing protein [Streptomyces endocoffeicus]